LWGGKAKSCYAARRVPTFPNAIPTSFPKQKVTWLKKKVKDLNDFKNYSYLCPQEIKNLFNYHSLKQKHYG